jgi:hypothetical protein
MKKGFSLMGIVFLVLMSCGVGSGKDYTYEDLQTFTDELNPNGTSFWEEFGNLKDKYNLTDSESKVVGMWTGLNETVARVFVFYPNKLFMVYFGRHKYKGEENKYLDGIYGVWEVRDNMLMITVHGFMATTLKADASVEMSEYFDVTPPYKESLININDVAIGGYTRKPFRQFVLPSALRSKIDIPPATKKKIAMVRSIYHINVITKSGRPEKSYGYLNVVPNMAADNVSGLEVATSTELVKKYFENLIF